MSNNIIQTLTASNRRDFLKHAFVGTSGLALAGTGCATGMKGTQTQLMSTAPTRKITYNGSSTVSLAAGKDQREAAYNSLKPLQSEIEQAINGKQVVIKVNMGQVAPDLWLNATDANFTRGILDFLKPFYDRPVIIGESTAAGPISTGPLSTKDGYANYGFLPLEKEYNAKLLDLNDVDTTKIWIRDNQQHPLGINIINTFLDPNVYMISATRLKQHNCLIVTLSQKNIAMAAPINHYLQKERGGRNEKPLMHSGGNRGLSYNVFRVATFGVQPDLAVLDGVVGMEGDGPVRGQAVEGGIAVASTDWVAADRIGTELMGNDYSEVKYLQWCAEAGMGTDDMSKIKLIGPDYRNHINKYRLSPGIEGQREWIHEDYKA